MTASQPAHAPCYPAGSIFDMTNLDQFTRGHPWSGYDQLRSQAPVYWQAVEPPARGYWLLSRFADIQHVSRHPELFSSAQGFKASDESYERLGPEISAAMGRIILSIDPPEHTNYRRILQEHFSLKAVKSREQQMRQDVIAILDRLQGKQTVEVVTAIASELPILVLCNVLGVPESDRPRIFEWTNRMVGIDDPEYNSSPQQAAQAFVEVFDYGRKLIAERRGKSGDDLITLIANAELDGKPLEQVQMDGFFVLMVGAGNETSRNSITGSLHALGRFPEVRQQLAEKPELIGAAVEELLRYVSPVIHMRRTATCDTEIAGQKIAKGEKVVMLYGAANRDPEMFENPDSLNLARQNLRHQIAFGHGIHLCLGAMYARMEIRIMLEEFLRRYPNYKVVEEPRYLRSHFVHGVKSMSIALT